MHVLRHAPPMNKDMGGNNNGKSGEEGEDNLHQSNPPPSLVLGILKLGCTTMNFQHFLLRESCMMHSRRDVRQVLRW